MNGINLTLMKTFWRERLTSPIRILFLILFWLFPVGLTFLHKPVRLPDGPGTLFLVMVLGGGVIGRDLSTGVIQLILARPVTRTEYVFSRWIGLAIVSFALAFLGWLIVLPFSLSGGGTTIAEAFGRLLEHLLNAFAMSAILTGFSAVLPGFFDLAMMAVGLIASQVLQTISMATQSRWLGRLGIELQATFIPTLYLKELTSGGTFHAYPLAVYFSSITLLLLLGIYSLNRREFSYATGG